MVLCISIDCPIKIVNWVKDYGIIVAFGCGNSS